MMYNALCIMYYGLLGRRTEGGGNVQSESVSNLDKNRRQIYTYMYVYMYIYIYVVH